MEKFGFGKALSNFKLTNSFLLLLVRHLLLLAWHLLLLAWNLLLIALTLLFSILNKRTWRGQFERNQVMDAGRPFWRVAATAQSMMTSLLQKLLLSMGAWPISS